MDSDDYFVDKAVQIIKERWEGEKENNKKYMGIVAPYFYPDLRRVSSTFPSAREAFLQDMGHKYKVFGDFVTVFRTDVIKELPDTPVFPGEKMAGEGYQVIQLPKNIPMLVLEEPISIKEYQKDGYTSNAYDLMFRNPRGFREYYKQYYLNGKYIETRMKGYLGYIACSILVKDYKYVAYSQKPFMVFILTPLGILCLQYLKYRRNKGKK